MSASDAWLDQSSRVFQAVFQASQGDRNGALRQLESVTRLGLPATHAALAAMAEMYFHAIDGTGQRGDYTLMLFDDDGQRVSVEEAPAPLRVAGQFLAAWGNQDQATANAVFLTLVQQDMDEGTDHCAVVLCIVLDLAATAMRERLQQVGG